MKIVRAAWKLLVGVKDALVLIFMLLFFVALFAALNARPQRAAVHEGALLMALDGTIVEQPAELDPLSRLAPAGDAIGEHRLRDVVHALDTARDDARIKAVVLDLDRFMGGYPATLGEVADAIARVRASGKPVLAYATAYTDSAYLLAASASEIWVNPLGGSLFGGPGGTRLYYKGLLDKLGVTAHVYRVGAFKSAVEPYIRKDMSSEARANYQALYGALFGQWKEAVAKARPKAKIGPFLSRPAELVQAAGGDIAEANRRAGLVDRVGDRVAFGKRVAEIVGSEADEPAGSFKATPLRDWISAHPLPRSGPGIGVLTIAGEIVDGESGAGTAGGATIARLMLEGLEKHELKALVVRVDSPGGSALAAEQMRQAILQAKARGLPVVVSMGGVAASGGYWVATPGDAIFAEPDTITGSIGIFGVLPSFEKTLAKIGVTTDGVQTTPLTGQPDLLGGTNATVDAIIQAAIESGYRRFVGLVAESRHMTPERVERIGGGRVWDGGTARQLGLVDRFGSLDDALAEAARRAKLGDRYHAVYLEKEPGFLAKLIESALQDERRDESQDAGFDLFGRVAQERRLTAAQAVGDARRLAEGASIQARCLECMGAAPAMVRRDDLRLLDLLLARFGG